MSCPCPASWHVAVGVRLGLVPEQGPGGKDVGLGGVQPLAQSVMSESLGGVFDDLDDVQGVGEEESRTEAGSEDASVRDDVVLLESIVEFHCLLLLAGLLQSTTWRGR